jgi:hypothetical protein
MAYTHPNGTTTDIETSQELDTLFRQHRYVRLTHARIVIAGVFAGRDGCRACFARGFAPLLA